MPIPRERGVTPDTVDRDPENLGAIFAKLRKNLVVESHLIAAHRTPVSRIEHENDRAPTELAQAEYLVGGGMQSEIGSRCAGAENFWDVSGRCGLCHSCLLRERFSRRRASGDVGPI